MRVRAVLAGAVLLLWAATPPPTADILTHRDAIGVWRVPESTVDQIEANAPPGKFYSVPHSFRYDGQCVTLQLTRLYASGWHSPDDFYRVQSRWDGSDLYIRIPFGGWRKLAAFTGGRFEQGEEPRWRFERAEETDLDEWELLLLIDREPHDDAKFRGRRSGESGDGR
jgi:hypothetical protein